MKWCMGSLEHVHSFIQMLSKRGAAGYVCASSYSAKWPESHRFIFLKCFSSFLESCLGLKEPDVPISNWFYIQEGICWSVLHEGGGNTRPRLGPVPGKSLCAGGSDGKLLTSDGPSRGLCQENREGFGSSEDPSPQHSLH